MASNWSVGLVLDALKTQLEARAGLAGVSVHTAWAGDEAPKSAANEWIQFGDAEGTSDPVIFASSTTVRRDDEEYDIDAAIWLRKPGAGNTQWKAARDRALAILAEVETSLRSDPKLVAGGGPAGLKSALVTRRRLVQAPLEGDRGALIEFTVNVKARI